MTSKITDTLIIVESAANLNPFQEHFPPLDQLGGSFLLGAGADSRRERFRGRAGLSREPNRIGQAPVKGR
ncbi:hypothetical protein KTH89_01460, partial [Lachnospiraceae bacterium ASD5720]|nr:hypothetical protein [Diplocloster agilis]